MGQIKSNLRLKMKFFALGRLKNHNVPHLHLNSTMSRLQLKVNAFSGKFNVCSKRVLLLWIKNCRDFTLETQIFTQNYRSWLGFYSEFLRKNWRLKALITIARPHRSNKKVHTQFDQADLREESASKNLQSGLLPKRKMCEKMQRGRSSSIMIF